MLHGGFNPVKKNGSDWIIPPSIGENKTCWTTTVTYAYSSVFNSLYQQPPHAHATYIHGSPNVSRSNPSACQLLKNRVAAL